MTLRGTNLLGGGRTASSTELNLNITQFGLSELSIERMSIDPGEIGLESP